MFRIPRIPLNINKTKHLLNNDKKFDSISLTKLSTHPREWPDSEIMHIPRDVFTKIPIDQHYPQATNIPHLSSQMMAGVYAWTHRSTRLPRFIYTRLEMCPEEQYLYQGVLDFSKFASQNPLFRIPPGNIYRATKLKYYPDFKPFIHQLGLTSHLHKPINWVDRNLLKKIALGLNINCDREGNPVLEFNTVRSWTTHDLVDNPRPLGNIYTEIFETDLIFVTNSKIGAYMKPISLVPPEEEIVTPPCYAKITNIGMSFRGNIHSIYPSQDIVVVEVELIPIA